MKGSIMIQGRGKPRRTCCLPKTAAYSLGQDREPSGPQPPPAVEWGGCWRVGQAAGQGAAGPLPGNGPCTLSQDLDSEEPGHPLLHNPVVVFSWGCQNHVPQSGGLTPQPRLTVLEVRSQRSGCRLA